ncbi:hypothetical protein WA158_005724 [Blastocystis sp. Blastoise]
MVGFKIKPLVYTGLGFIGVSFGYAYQKKFYSLKDRPLMYKDKSYPILNDKDENILMKTARLVEYLPICLASKILMHTSNSITSYNTQYLEQIFNRPKNQGVISVSNHQTTIDIMLACINGLPGKTLLYPSHYPYILNSEEYAFKNKLRAYFASIVRIMPIRRGDGIYQIELTDFTNKVKGGNWVHIYPEGRTYQSGPFCDRAADGCYYTPSGRHSPPNRKLGPLKWGVGRIISECEVTPIILPFYQLGLEGIQPQKENRVCVRALPFGGNHATIIYGEPIKVEDILSHYRPLVAEEQDPQKKIIIQEEMYKSITERIEQALEKLENECKQKEDADMKLIHLSGRKY